MNNTMKRFLSLLLAMVMMISVPMFALAEEITDDSVSMFSLFPIEEVRAVIDLTDYSTEKLMNMTTAELFANLKNAHTDEAIAIDPAATTVWSNFFDEEGNYKYDSWKVLGMEDTLNVLSYYMEDRYDVEIIIGSGNQLDETNKRYFVNFEFPKEYAEIDLSDCIRPELYEFEVSEILDRLTIYDEPLTITDTETVEILWNVDELINYGYEFENAVDGWISLGYNDVVKYAPTTEEMWGSGIWPWEDQIMLIKADENSALYDIEVFYPEYYNMFELSLYTQTEKKGVVSREAITLEDIYEYDTRNRDSEGVYTYGICIYGNVNSKYSPDEEYYFGLSLTEDFADKNVKLFKGWDNSLDVIKNDIVDGTFDDVEDVTDLYFVEDMSAENAGVKAEWLNYCEEGELTLCVIDGDEIYLEPICFDIYPNTNHVYVESSIFADKDDVRTDVYNHRSSEWDDEKVDDVWYEKRIYTYYLDEGYEADDEYSISMRFYDGDTHEYIYDTSRIDKAVIGHYYSLDDVEKREDIKEQLFVEDMYVTGAGYKDNFSGDGVDFTIFSGDDIWLYTIKIAENEDEEPEMDDGAPELGSSDRYFRVNSLYNGDNELDTYIIPYEHDTYYSYGYQTLLINDTEADMTSIAPEAYLGYHAKVYYNDTLEETDDDNYSNKLTARDFTTAPADTTRDPKGSIRYTVSAENHIDQKNYWITAVKKEEGAKLFVNGPDEREIFLNNYFDNAHDIFVANVGTEELTGITVTLDATNVKLDDYWTIGGEGNNTLAPFTETYNDNGNYYGELFNVAKIRLIPDGEGEINGTLTITADGQEPRVITLKGTAGNPKIDTAALHDAVKYVPYSAIVTTNNMHDWNKVTFDISKGKLPEGVKIYPSGEIYGVPKETGEFPITVVAEYSYDAFDDSYADLVLTVQDNTDENVNASVDEGYAITIRVPDEITKYQDREFEIEGVLAEFIDFWLDGEKLVRDVDYTAEEGSTKITIKSQTFSNAGSGKHTISAEFRVDGDRNKDLKKASQNYTKSGSSGGSNGGGGGVASYKVTFEANGGVGADTKMIKKGSLVQDLPIPTKEGYVFGGWYKDEALTEAFGADDKITSRITLYAKWDAVAPEIVIPEEAPVVASGFIDVNETDWFYDDVQWAYENELMVGYNNAQFAPEDAITGGMVVAILARLADVNVDEYADKAFDDVYEDQWYTPYAKWAKAEGIVEGIPFNPPAEITREWMGIVLDRYLDYVKAEYEVNADVIEFADAELISDEAMDAIQTLFKLDIFRGKGNNVIDPTSNTTRAEFAALIHRVDTFLNK